VTKAEWGLLAVAVAVILVVASLKIEKYRRCTAAGYTLGFCFQRTPW
jgi:hypothetical protein